MQTNFMIERVIFSNRANNWTVLTAKKPNAPKSEKAFKVVGILPLVDPSLVYTADLVADNTQMGGLQYNIGSICIDPKQQNIELYLIKKGVRKLPENAILHLLQTSLQVNFRSLYKNIAYKDILTPDIINHLNNFILFLEQLQLLDWFIKNKLSTEYYLDCYNDLMVVYPTKTPINLLEENPYILVDYCMDNFDIIDKLGQERQLTQSDLRIYGGLHYLLRKNERNGNTWIQQRLLAAELYNLLHFIKPHTTWPLDGALGKIIIFGENNNKYAREETYKKEDYIKRKLITYKTISRLTSTDSLDTIQNNAAIMASSHRYSIITGGPGTGKTHIIRRIIETVPDKDKIVLLAPTGKAAVRIQELVGLEAFTIHSYLQPTNRRLTTFVYNSSNKLPEDCLYIVDEMSMVTVDIFYSLLEALPDTAKLILIGDVDQLPPIGPGDVLRNLIDTKHIPSERLIHNYRSKDNSGIISNAYRVLEDKKVEPAVDFTIIEANTALDIKRLVEKFIVQYPDIQCLVPTNVGAIGTNIINPIYQNKNPGQHIKGTRFKIGDKILFNMNNKDMGYMRGDIGYINFVTENKDVCISMYSKDSKIKRTIPIDLLSTHSLGYAITVHKAQGSEFDNVLLIFFDNHRHMYNKNLVFTAITRARKQVIWIQSKTIANTPYLTLSKRLTTF